MCTENFPNYTFTFISTTASPFLRQLKYQVLKEQLAPLREQDQTNQIPPPVKQENKQCQSKTMREEQTASCQNYQ